ncbi:hypothetical protein [Streptomyces sp. NPDC018352]|uniref:hypothetical protein n=1 Tax=Streptomyces sp. NPDC018352 TaxID=3157194 RepID=UPI0033C1F6C5
MPRNRAVADQEPWWITNYRGRGPHQRYDHHNHAKTPRTVGFLARTGATFPAQVWAPIHGNVCIRHKLWIGQHVHAPEQQLDLSRAPDVVRAQQRYWRLRRHHGPVLINICDDVTPGSGPASRTATTGSSTAPRSFTTSSESRDPKPSRT